DRLAQGDGPAVLDQGDPRGGAGRNGVSEVPDLLLAVDMALLQRGRAESRALLGALLAGSPQSQQRARERSELGSFILRQVAHLGCGELAVLALGDEQQVDQAHDVVLAQALQLAEDLPRELAVPESDHQQLYGS